MIKIMAILICFAPTLCFSVSVSFVGPCDEKPLWEGGLLISEPLSVGALTLEVLEKYKIPYEGAERGIQSIFNTPTGLEALEILSKEEMRAYGWCYSVNGIRPEDYPDKVFIQEVDHVTWWFGYAHYKKGEWQPQCELSYLIRPSFLCLPD